MYWTVPYNIVNSMVYNYQDMCIFGESLRFIGLFTLQDIKTKKYDTKRGSYRGYAFDNIKWRYSTLSEHIRIQTRIRYYGNIIYYLNTFIIHYFRIKMSRWFLITNEMISSYV